jgi:hypothetical protein
MKLISFDIGIKNMAYCLFDIQSTGVSIQEWNVMNLMDEQEQDIVCSCELVQKKKSLENTKICGKKAKYRKGEETFCEKHAKMRDQWIIPTKQISVTALKKLKLDDLLKLGTAYGAQGITNEKKAEVLSKIVSHFEEKCFVSLEKVKQKSASDTDLITIGRNMREKFDDRPWIQDLDVAIMENQISPLAGRMKTIQGMLAQYFIMKSVDTIDFISSSNKLKGLTEKPDSTVTEKEKYKKHKQDSIVICKRFLEENTELKSWSSSLDTTKKDDLADCFLQGIWYLKKTNRISYNADDLKINIVYLK